MEFRIPQLFPIEESISAAESVYNLFIGIGPLFFFFLLMDEPLEK